MCKTFTSNKIKSLKLNLDFKNKLDRTINSKLNLTGNSLTKSAHCNYVFCLERVPLAVNRIKSDLGRFDFELWAERFALGLSSNGETRQSKVLVRLVR